MPKMTSTDVGDWLAHAKAKGFIQPGEFMYCSDVFSHYAAWAEENGPHVRNKISFGLALAKECPKILTTQIHHGRTYGGKRRRAYIFPKTKDTSMPPDLAALFEDIEL